MFSFEVVLTLFRFTHQPTNAALAPALAMLARSTGVKWLHLCLPCPQLQGRIVGVDLTRVLDAVDSFVRTAGTESTVLRMDPTALMGLDEGARRLGAEERALPAQARVDKHACWYPEVLVPLQDPASPELGLSRGYWTMESQEQVSSFWPLLYYGMLRWPI
jgi:hypothetical protein